MAGNRNISKKSSAKVLRASAAAVAVCAGTAASLGQPVATFTGGCGTNQWLGTCQQGGLPVSNWSTSPNIPYSIHHAVVPASAGPTMMCGTKLLYSFDCQAPLTICESSQLLAYQDSHVKDLVVAIGGSISVLDGPGTLWLDGTSMIAGGLGSYAVTNTGYCTLTGTPSFAGQLVNDGTMTIDATSINFTGWANVGVLTNSGVLNLRTGHVYPQIINQGSMGKTTSSGMIIDGLATFESGSFSVFEGSILMAGGSKWKGGTATLSPGTSLVLVPPLGATANTHEWDGIASFEGEGTINVVTSATRPLIIKQSVALNDVSDGHVTFGAMPPGNGLVRIGDATLTNSRTMMCASTTFERVPGTTQGRIVNDSGSIVMPDFGTGVTLGVDLDTNWQFEQNADLSLTGNATLTVGGGSHYLRKGDIFGAFGAQTPRVMVEGGGVLSRPFDAAPSPSTISLPTDMDGGMILVESPEAAPLVLTGGGVWKGGFEIEVEGTSTSASRLTISAGTYTVEGVANVIRSRGYTHAQAAQAGSPGPTIVVAGGSELTLAEGSAWLAGLQAGFSLGHGATLAGPGRTTVTGGMAIRGGAIGGGGTGNLENAGTILFGAPPTSAGSSTISGVFLNRMDGEVIHGEVGTFESPVAVQAGIVQNLGRWEINSGAKLTIQPGAVFRNEGEFRKWNGGGAAVSGPFDNPGKVHVEQGTLTFTGPVSQISAGVLTGGEWEIDPGQTLVLPGPLTKIGAGANVHGSSASILGSVTHVAGQVSLNGNFQFNAGLHIELGGMVQIPPATTTTVGQPGLVIEGSSAAGVLSSLKGGLCICDGPSESFVVTPLLDNGGAIVPGGDGEPGILDLTGAYEQSATGELWIELGGVTPGMQHDVFEVSGQAALAGTLRVALIDDFVPSIGHEFTILTAASIAGTFDTLDLPALPAGRAWEVLYSPGFEPWVMLRVTGPCYPDCNESGTLTVADFGCFQGKYVLGDLYADCTGEGTLTVADFGCFQGKYVLGCP